jgi:hypothetical protein
LGGRWQTVGVVLLGAVVALLGVKPALAQDKKTVTVLEIQGAPPKLQAGLEKALKSKYTVLPAAKWNSAAKRLNVTGQAADEVALVAGDLKVDAVVTGKVKQDKDSGTYKLNIAARHGATGKPLGKLSYEMKSQKVDSATIASAEADIEKAVDEAIAGPPPEPPPVVAQAEPLSPSMRGEEENPLEKMKKMEEKAKHDRDHVDRQIFYPYFDVGAAFILNGRSFSYTEGADPVKCYDFNQKTVDPTDFTGTKFIYTYLPANKTCPAYRASVTGGVRADLTGYPLAGIPIRPLRGLGIGITFDWMFWPPSMTSSTPPRPLDTREFRLEAGLRYHWNILNRRDRPSLLVNAQYGVHFFAIAKEQTMFAGDPNMPGVKATPGVDDHGLPDILYQYVTVGLGGRVPYYATERLYFGLVVNFNFHIMLNYGELGTSFADPASVSASAPVNASLYAGGGYGAASGYGFRAGFTPLEAMLFKGLTVRLSGFYESFATTFALGQQTLPPSNRSLENSARHIAQGASDQYFGGVVQVGYQY